MPLQRNPNELLEQLRDEYGIAGVSTTNNKDGSVTIDHGGREYRGDDLYAALEVLITFLEG